MHRAILNQKLIQSQVAIAMANTNTGQFQVKLQVNQLIKSNQGFKLLQTSNYIETETHPASVFAIAT